MLKSLIAAAFGVALGTCSLVTSAQTQKFQKWTVYNYSGGPSALTFNDSQNGLGPVCSDDTNACYWMILSPGTACSDGVKSPVLINASSGSYSLVAHCTGSIELAGTTYHRYLISKYEEMQRIAESSTGLIGFAIPLDSGSFSVLRFDLTGAKAALKSFDKISDDFLNRQQKSSTKDIRL